MWTLCALAAVLAGARAGEPAAAPRIERWGVFEAAFRGPAEGNPFLETTLKARFHHGSRTVDVDGFYDGNGVYRVRFMPDQLGRWRYVTSSNRKELDGRQGEFICAPPSPGNHGPVRIRGSHFFYADGTPFFQVGTTCYAWIHQPEALQQETLETLRRAPFNKLRMCVFPKHYDYNHNEPPLYPFEGRPPREWDFTRFNPAFFRHLEQRVRDLADLGVEADLILFHPYDRWGFSKMGRENNLRYLRYVTARLAAFRNVWWSLANEYDLLRWPMEDWDRYFQLIEERDPYGRPRSIHNCRKWYDHAKPWVTHLSVQGAWWVEELGRAIDLPAKYGKPAVFDEVRYEGDIPRGWGNLAPQQLVKEFWIGTVSGCYVGHGETYLNPQEILWWSKGGVLRGQSPERIAFLREIMEEGPPFHELRPSLLSKSCGMLSLPGRYWLLYFTAPDAVELDLPPGRRFKADLIDTWQMTVHPLGGAVGGKFRFRAPEEGCALRLTPYREGEKTRPAVRIEADPASGKAPLDVRFRASPRFDRLEWRFGDGTSSHASQPFHVYRAPGRRTVKLLAWNRNGETTAAFCEVAADRDPAEPIVRLGFPENEIPKPRLYGEIVRGPDGSYELGDGPPWKRISLGREAGRQLEGLLSFTALGWLRPRRIDRVGPGGNRILFSLNGSRSGIDLVHLADGRLRLAVNEWPDRIRDDSSPGKLKPGRWTFFAVAYDGAKRADNVRWHFGDEQTPATLDRTVTYPRGGVEPGSGPLAVGNFNQTMESYGYDRQFRGAIRGLQIFGSCAGSKGAFSLEQIRKLQFPEKR